MNINNPTTFSAPDLTLTTSNSSGTAGALRADDSVLIYDTTLPDAITYGQSGSVGDTATAARRNHSHAMAASDAVAQATQAEAEAESDVDKYLPPDLLRYSPGVAKGWCRIAQNGSIVGSTAYPNSYNVSATSTAGTGNYTVSWRDDFSSTTYTVVSTTGDAGDYNSSTGSFAAGSTQIYNVTASTGTATDLASCVVSFGDQ